MATRLFGGILYNYVEYLLRTDLITTMLSHNCIIIRQVRHFNEVLIIFKT